MDGTVEDVKKQYSIKIIMVIQVTLMMRFFFFLLSV